MKKLLLLLCIFLSACETQVSPYWDGGDPNSDNSSQNSFNSNSSVSNFNKIGKDVYEVVGDVKVHKEKNISSPLQGYLLKGAVVEADCSEDGWCAVAGGYVISACLGVGEKKCK